MVGGKIVHLGVLEPERVEVVEAESSTVVQKVPRAIMELRESEVVHGALASLRGSGGPWVGMGQSRRRDLHGYGTRSGGGSVNGGVQFPGGNGSTGGFYARGRERGEG